MTRISNNAPAARQAELQFGHAQRAWDDEMARLNCSMRAGLLQFGHAQRAWDDLELSSGLARGKYASIRPRPEGVG